LILCKSCQAAKKWIHYGYIQSFSVNLSAHQMQDEAIADDVLEALHSAHLNPRHLVIEITEGVFLDDLETVRGSIERLTTAGVRLALDDFGSGYSNLWQLRLRPISQLKIDRSLLSDLDCDQRAQIIFRNVVSLARSLGLRTVAEGVERSPDASLSVRSGATSFRVTFVEGRLLRTTLRHGLRVKLNHNGSHPCWIRMCVTRTPCPTFLAVV